MSFLANKPKNNNKKPNERIQFSKKQQKQKQKKLAKTKKEIETPNDRLNFPRLFRQTNGKTKTQTRKSTFVYQFKSWKYDNLTNLCKNRFPVIIIFKLLVFVFHDREKKNRNSNIPEKLNTKSPDRDR